MGKLSQGPFQGFIGKTGGLVGKRWKGKYIVSQYQPVVANPKSFKQMQQRDFFKSAIALVTATFNSKIREYLSGGYPGTTVNASNIGFVARMYRQIHNANNGIDVVRPLDYIKRGAMMSGLDDFGNTILDSLKLTQMGTTSAFNLTFKTSAGVKFIGSDVSLEKLTGFVCLSEDGVNVSYLPFDINPSSEEVDKTIEKAFGFQDTADACGNWNFVYKANWETLALAIGGTSIPSQVKGQLVNECFANVGFYNETGTVISSRWLYLPITIV